MEFLRHQRHAMSVCGTHTCCGTQVEHDCNSDLFGGEAHGHMQLQLHGSTAVRVCEHGDVGIGLANQQQRHQTHLGSTRLISPA
jgi:hypothetical protein